MTLGSGRAEDLSADGADSGSAEPSKEALAERLIVEAHRHALRRNTAEEWAAYDRAATEAPRYAKACLCRGRALMERREFDAAIEDFTQVIALRPPDELVGYFFRGAAWFAKGDYQKSLEDFDEVVARDPTLWAGYEGRGIARFYLAEYDGAIEDFTEAINVDTGYLSAHPSLGYDGPLGGCYQYQVPIDPLEDSRPSRWEMGGVHAHRGAAWFYRGEYERALTDLNHAIDLAGLSLEANFYRGLARLALGKCDLGRTDLMIAAQFGHKDYETIVRRTRAFVSETKCADVKL